MFGGILELVLGVSAGTLEERVVNVGADTLDGHFLGGSDHVSGVDSSKRNSIDLIGSGHKEET